MAGMSSVFGAMSAFGGCSDVSGLSIGEDVGQTKAHSSTGSTLGAISTMDSVGGLVASTMPALATTASGRKSRRANGMNVESPHLERGPTDLNVQGSRVYAGFSARLFLAFGACSQLFGGLVYVFQLEDHWGMALIPTDEVLTNDGMPMLARFQTSTNTVSTENDHQCILAYNLAVFADQFRAIGIAALLGELPMPTDAPAREYYRLSTIAHWPNRPNALPKQHTGIPIFPVAPLSPVLPLALAHFWDSQEDRWARASPQFQQRRALEAAERQPSVRFRLPIVAQVRTAAMDMAAAQSAASFGTPSMLRFPMDLSAGDDVGRANPLEGIDALQDHVTREPAPAGMITHPSVPPVVSSNTSSASAKPLLSSLVIGSAHAQKGAVRAASENVSRADPNNGCDSTAQSAPAPASGGAKSKSSIAAEIPAEIREEFAGLPPETLEKMWLRMKSAHTAVHPDTGPDARSRAPAPDRSVIGGAVHPVSATSAKTKASSKKAKLGAAARSAVGVSSSSTSSSSSSAVSATARRDSREYRRSRSRSRRRQSRRSRSNRTRRY